MDFSWVKGLADEANQKEEARQADLRQEKLDQRQLAFATVPFVEKLQLLITACAEEFNKYIQYQHLQVTTTRLQKRNKSIMYKEDPNLAYPEESGSFSFSRGNWTYAIRGSNGVVEFIEIASAGNTSAFGYKLDEININPSRRFIAHLDKRSNQVVWTCDDQVLDGSSIVLMCKDFFKEFIERTSGSGI